MQVRTNVKNYEGQGGGKEITVTIRFPDALLRLISAAPTDGESMITAMIDEALSPLEDCLKEVLGQRGEEASAN